MFEQRLDTTSDWPVPRVVVALDFSDLAAVDRFVEQLDPRLCRLKVGKELFTRFGPSLVESLSKRGFAVFLDLKFHDIPNTVAAACRAAADLGVWMVNVHALGGRRMLEAASNELAKLSAPPLLIAVTVLTSMERSDLTDIGVDMAPSELVLRLARLAANAGLAGVVCSAQEAAALRARHGDAFCLVCPGVRPAGAAADDQRRVMTPGEAMAAGASYLVIGRPVTRSDEPLHVLRTIESEISDMLLSR